VHQQALPDSRARLPHHEIIQPVAMQAQPSAAEANSAGGHEHDLAAIFLERSNRSRYRRKMLDIEMAVASRHNAGAKLDHRTPRRAQSLQLFAL
jgi:hypothetical protein